MPDLDDLTRYDPAAFPPAVPAEEIRRRGDRRRRRRTALVAGGGVLAVALAVGTPVVAFSGGGDHRRFDPAPRPTQSTTPHQWLTETLDFPLTDGFPSPFQEADAGQLPTCGDLRLVQHAAERVVTYAGESEDTAQRMLLLFDSDTKAQQQMAALKDATSDCAPVPLAGGGAQRQIEPVITDHVSRGTEDMYVYAAQVHHDDGLVSDLTLVEVFRTGNAVFIDSRYGAPGGDQAIGEMLRLMEHASQEPRALLCVFAANPCLDPYAPAPSDGTVTPAAADGRPVAGNLRALREVSTVCIASSRWSWPRHSSAPAAAPSGRPPPASPDQPSARRQPPPRSRPASPNRRSLARTRAQRRSPTSPATSPWRWAWSLTRRRR